jgi:hypothetical protein
MAGDAVQKSPDTFGKVPSPQLRLDTKRGLRLRLVAAFTNIVWGG